MFASIWLGERPVVATAAAVEVPAAAVVVAAGLLVALAEPDMAGAEPLPSPPHAARPKTSNADKMRVPRNVMGRRYGQTPAGSNKRCGRVCLFRLGLPGGAGGIVK